MPSRLVKKTSLVVALTLGTAVSGSAVWAASPPEGRTPAVPSPVMMPQSTSETMAASAVDDAVVGKDAPLFTPMSDAAAMGVGCFAATTSSLAAAYAMGPTELMMLVTGAVIVPTTSSLLFIALGGILGAGACGVGAALTPSVLWAAENAEGISGGITEGIKTSLKPKIPSAVAKKMSVLEKEKTDIPAIRPMNEGEIQGAGCLLGVLGLGAVALATAPTEAVMLAAGGVGVPSSTPLLMMGMLGTLLPAGCTFGAVASLPLMTLYQNFDTNAIGQKLASMVGWGKSSSPLVLRKTEESKAEQQAQSLSLSSAELSPNVPMQMVRQESAASMLSTSSSP